ncbi:MAG: N-acetylmuramoyl-L-alanine amidase [Verrucomicrobiota bacterium]
MHPHSRRAAYAAACLFATTSSGRAQLSAEPQWWSAPGTGIWAAGPVNVENARPLNVGQLKHVASQARTYLDNVLQPWGGAGTAITTLTTQFQGNSTNPLTPVADRAENAAPVNVGQLKQVAELFYDRLAELELNAGMETAFRLGGVSSLRPGKSYTVPWLNNLPSAENAGIATIGQLKMAFGFEVDLDNDGVLDAFEWAMINATSTDAWVSLVDITALLLDADSDGDGITNAREFTLKFNALLADSDGNGTRDLDPETLKDPYYDSDGDGLANGLDAVPEDRWMMFPRVPESRYALIDLGPGTAHSINAAGQVLRGWQTADFVNHAEVMPGAGASGPAQPIPETWPIRSLHGLSDQGTAFFSVDETITVSGQGSPEITVPRLYRSHAGAMVALPPAPHPVGLPWGMEAAWNLQGLTADGPVTAGGSLFNGLQNGSALQRYNSLMGGGIFYPNFASATYDGKGLSWTPVPAIRPLPSSFFYYSIGGMTARQNNPEPIASSSGVIPLNALASYWPAVSRQGDAIHFRRYQTGPIPEGETEPPQADEHTFWSGLDSANSHPEPCALGADSAQLIASIPAVAGKSIGPMVLASTPEGLNHAYVRTPQGWQQTVLKVSPEGAPFSFPLWPTDLPTPLMRYASTANARGEFLHLDTLWRNGRAHPIQELVQLPPQTTFLAADINANGLICGTLISQSGARAALLLPVEIVELSPKVKDEDGNEISDSWKPSTGKALTPFVEIDPHANKIAHRELKVLIGSSMKGKKVIWTLEPVPGATPVTIRGAWTHSTTHPNRFDASTAYGDNGFTSLSQGSGRTIVSNDGFTAIRVNVPPIGFNQVRIKIQIEETAMPIDLIDMEVPGVVVIDPGHGGIDSGTVGAGGVEEKELALAYGLSLRQQLIKKFTEENRGLQVVMTRKTTDFFPSKSDRPQQARDSGADVFVSIHFNDLGATPRGTETFVERTAAEASASNPGDNKNVDEDLGLANALNSTTLNAVAASDAGAFNRGVKRAGFTVTLDGPTYNGNTLLFRPVKACLVEVENLSNATALETIKLSNATGVTVKASFAQNGATDIFNNIRDQQ